MDLRIAPSYTYHIPSNCLELIESASSMTGPALSEDGHLTYARGTEKTR